MSIQKAPTLAVPCCRHCLHPVAELGHDSQCDQCLNERAENARRADTARVRAELRDRLDRCTDADHGAAFGWLADNHADLVREALDETGAPS